MKKPNLLRIVLPEGEKIKAGDGTRCFVGSEELTGIESIDIHIAREEVITATLRIAPGAIENLEGLCTQIRVIAEENR